MKLPFMPSVTIRDIPKTRVLTCNHNGSYMHINQAFDELCGWLVAHNSFPPQGRLIAIYFDDPRKVAEENLRSCAGVVLPEGVKIESPFEERQVGGGPHAVVRHIGPYEGLGSVHQWLQREWLPKSGKEAADAPVFEEYLNTPGDTAPADLVTDICLPLR